MLYNYSIEEKPYWEMFFSWHGSPVICWGVRQGQLQVQVKMALQHLPSQLSGQQLSHAIVQDSQFFPVSASGENQLGQRAF